MPWVKNIAGTGDKKCKCDSWLKHWEDHGGGRKPSICWAVSCNNRVSVGAHVLQRGDTKHYITPLCHECNSQESEFEVVGPLVSANVSETCGKLPPIYKSRVPY